MEKKNKKSMIIGITALLLVTLTLLGLTYAYYRTRIVGNENDTSVSVTSKKMEIVYADNKETITATNIEPGKFSETKAFSVENTGDATINYSIILDEVNNEFVLPGWEYELYEINGTTKSLVTTGVLRRLKEQNVVENIEILSNTVHNYEITFTYSDTLEDQSEDMGKSLKLRINIKEATEWDKATSGTLLYAIKSANSVEDPLTIPAKEASIETEAVLASAEDDYGTSYYFRGNVKNNYVYFNNMCWRIVRVEGDGSIKLVLENRTGACDAAAADDYYGYPFIEALSFYGSDETDTQALANYTNATTKNESSVKTFLTNWFNSKFSSTIQEKIKSDTTFCIGNTSDLYNQEDPYNLLGTGTEYKNTLRSQGTEFYYDNKLRIDYEKGEYVNPSYLCEGEKYDKDNYYVGILTVDEAAFAGFSEDSSTEYSYLVSEYMLKTPDYWLLSQVGFYNANGETYDGVYRILGNKLATATVAVSGSPKRIRPVISLKNDVTIVQGGTGTKDNPYVIG